MDTIGRRAVRSLVLAEKTPFVPVSPNFWYNPPAPTQEDHFMAPMKLHAPKRGSGDLSESYSLTHLAHRWHVTRRRIRKMLQREASCRLSKSAVESACHVRQSIRWNTIGLTDIVFWSLAAGLVPVRTRLSRRHTRVLHSCAGTSPAANELRGSNSALWPGPIPLIATGLAHRVARSVRRVGIPWLVKSRRLAPWRGAASSLRRRLPANTCDGG